jgi:ATP phosphoribosyltransferase
MTQPRVRLALPSKGQLGDSTLLFLKACGLTLDKTNPRQYSATIPALPEVQVYFQRSADIPLSVSHGNMDLGITGIDTLEEHALEEGSNVKVLHNALDYGACSLVLAIPDQWPITHLSELAQFTREKGSLRVATKFPNLTTRFLQEADVAPIKVVLASGALEAMPAIGSADFISDLTATGTTLRDNHLRPLEDGVILRSQACLVGNPDALRSRPEVQQVARRMLEFFEGHLSGLSRYLVFANMRGESPEAVANRIFTQTALGGLTGPTIAPVYSERPSSAGYWFSVSLAVHQKQMVEAIQQLRNIGASGVVVTPITYIFDEYPDRCRQLDDFVMQKENQA